MSPSPSLLNTFDIRSGASAWLLFGSSECVLGLSYPISSRVRASSSFEKKPSLLHLPSQTIENKRFKDEDFTLIFLHLDLHPSPWQAMARRTLAQRV